MKTKWLNKISKYLYLYTIGLMVLIYYSYSTDWTLLTPPPCNVNGGNIDVSWTGPKVSIICPDTILELNTNCDAGCCYKIIYYEKFNHTSHYDPICKHTYISKEPILDIVGIFYEGGCNCSSCTNRNQLISLFYRKYWDSLLAIPNYFENNIKLNCSEILNGWKGTYDLYTTSRCFDVNESECEAGTIRCCHQYDTVSVDSSRDRIILIDSLIELPYAISACPSGCNKICKDVVFKEDTASPIQNFTCTAPYLSATLKYYYPPCCKYVNVNVCYYCYVSADTMIVQISEINNICPNINQSELLAAMRDSILNDKTALCGTKNCLEGSITITLKFPLCVKTHWDGTYITMQACPDNDNNGCFQKFDKCWYYYTKGNDTLVTTIVSSLGPKYQVGIPQCSVLTDEQIIQFIKGYSDANGYGSTPWTTSCYGIECK